MASPQILFILFNGFKLDKSIYNVYNILTIEFNDPSYFYFMGDKSRQFTNITDIINHIKKIIHKNNIQHTFLFGLCRGGYSAMMIGSQINNSYIFALSPVFSITEKDNENIKDGRFLGDIPNKIRQIGLKNNPGFADKLNVLDTNNPTCMYYIFHTKCPMCRKQLTLLYDMPEIPKNIITDYNYTISFHSRYDVYSTNVINILNGILAKLPQSYIL